MGEGHRKENPAEAGSKAKRAAFVCYGFVAGAGAIDGGAVGCGAVFMSDPGRAGPVVVGVFSVVLGLGVCARSLAKSNHPPIAISAAKSAKGRTFQAPSSVRVARSQVVLLRGPPRPSATGSSLVGGRSSRGL